MKTLSAHLIFGSVRAGTRIGKALSTALVVAATSGMVGCGAKISNSRLRGSVSTPTSTPTGALLSANSQSLTTLEDQVGSGTLSSVNPSGGALTYALTSNGSKGAAAITNAATGAFTYTPNANQNGTDALTFEVSDGTMTSSASVNVTITPVNDMPSLSSISTLTGANEDSAFAISYATLLGASDAADVDGDAISFRIETVSSGTLTKNGVAVTAGSTLISSGESLVWTPASNVSGNLNAFTVRAYDGVLASTSAEQVVVNVTSVNDAPTLSTVSTLATATEDTAFTISYATLAGAANEADLDGDPISFRVESVSTGTLTKGGIAVTAGTTLLSAGEDLVWTPAANANGSLNAFAVRAYDGASASSTAVQVVVTTSAVNDAPTLASISTLAGATEDTAFTVSYATLAGAADEADVDGDALSFRVEAVSSGTLTKGGVAVTAGTTLISSGETLVWTPASGANGNLNAFTVRAYDGAAASSSAIQVVVTVGAVNDAPTLSAIANLATATEDTAFSITYAALAAAADEADPEGNPISFRVETVSSGTLTKGGVAVTAGSTLLSSGETLVWTPAADANGNLNAFTVRAHDGNSASSAAVQVVVTTSAVADAPTLSSVNTLTGASENAGYTITYAALFGASNAADADGDAISFRVEAVSTGTLTKGGVAVTPGATTIASGETLVWTPDLNANGSLNAFTVRAHDGALASSSAVQVVVSVGSMNSVPTLTNVSTLATATEDTAFTISYTALAAAANEADADGDPISFRVEAVSSGTLTKVGVAVTAGSTLLSSGESLVWTPASNANGTLNAFTVRAYDGSLASASAIQVAVSTSAVNDAPTLSSISTLTGASEDTAFTISYATLFGASNAADVEGDSISFRIEAVSSGTLTKGGVAVTPGTTMLASGESLVWTPASGANGDLNAFTVRAHDGSAASSSAIQVVVNTGSVNDAPTLSTISTLATATEDTAFTISYATLASAANEADADGDAISFRVEAVSTGTLTKGGVAVTAGTTMLASGESLVWTPASNANGNLNAFTVRAHDGSAASATAVQVVVTTSAVNDAPTLSSISTLAGASEDTAFTISYATLASAANEADVDGDALSFRVEAVSTGTLTKGGVAVTAGTTTIASGESWVWTPAANASGSLNAFTVRAFDGVAASSSAVQVVVSVTSANDAPTLTSISTLATATEDTAFTLSYATLAGAADEADADGDALSFRIEAVSTGTLTKGGVAVTAGSTTLASGESLVWTPAANANGTLNAFTVRAYDGSLASSSAVQVVVTTSSVNDVPTLTSISTLATATEDTAFTISYTTLAAAANEADADGDALSFRIEAVSTGTLTKGGTAVTAGTTLLSSGESLVWTPASNANGTLNAFTVRAHDGTAVSSSAIQVTVTTSAVNDAPTLTSISTLATATEDTAFTLSYATLAGAADEADTEGSAISFLITGVTTGTLTKGGVAVIAGTTLISSGESVVWTPAANANGTLNAFTLKAHDGSLASSTDVQVVVTTSAGNDAPTLTTVSTLATATEDTAFTISYAALAAAANEADVDGDTLSFRVEAISSGTLTKGGVGVVAGTTLLGSGESIVWTPDANANGTLGAFTVRAHDGTLASASAIQVNITTSAVNDPPTITAIADQTIAFNTATSALSFTVGDVETAAGSLTLSGTSSNTTIVPNANIVFGGSGASRTVTVTPASGQSGAVNITVTVSDGGLTSSDVFQLTINPGVNLEVPIEMIGQGIIGPASTTIYERSRTFLDTAEFDGTVTYYSELVIYNKTGTSKTIDLVNSAGSVVATHTVADNGGVFERKRISFTPTAGSNNYRIRMPSATSSSDLQLRAARIIVKQVGATKTRLYYPLLGVQYSSSNTDLSSGGSPLDVDLTSWSNGSDLASPIDDAGNIWVKESSKLATVAAGTPWRLDVIMNTQNTPTEVYGALYNRTSGAVVAASQVSTTGTYSSIGTSFADNATDFTDDNQFEFRARSSISGDRALIYKAVLSVRLDPLTKGQVLHRVGLGDLWPASGTGEKSRALIDTSLYTNPTSYFEVTRLASSTSSGSFYLGNAGVNDTGSSISSVSGTSFAATTTKTRSRSAALSLTSGNRYMLGITYSSGTLYSCGGSFVVIDFGN